MEIHAVLYKKVNSKFTGLERIVKRLIDNGADINHVNKYNNSALILAIQSGKNVKILTYSVEMKVLEKTFFFAKDLKRLRNHLFKTELTSTS